MVPMCPNGESDVIVSEGSPSMRLAYPSPVLSSSQPTGMLSTMMSAVRARLRKDSAPSSVSMSSVTPYLLALRARKTPLFSWWEMSPGKGPMAREDVTLRRLYLDDLGAEVSKGFAAIWCGNSLTEFEHSYAVEHTLCHAIP